MEGKGEEVRGGEGKGEGEKRRGGHEIVRCECSGYGDDMLVR